MINDTINFFLDNDIVISESECNKLLDYKNLFQEENKKINLMSKNAEENFLEEHLLDSFKFKLVNLAQMKIDSSWSLIDLGSGGGLPAIPIGITHPGCKITLTESVKKKSDFLSKVISKLELKNCSVKNQRVEEIGQDILHRESYDIVTSRALASFPVLLEYALPFLRIGGICIFYKTQKEVCEIEKQITVLRLLGASIVDIIEYGINSKESKRALVKIKKIEETPKRFPRRAGMATKRPLA